MTTSTCIAPFYNRFVGTRQGERWSRKPVRSTAGPDAPEEAASGPGLTAARVDDERMGKGEITKVCEFFWRVEEDFGLVDLTPHGAPLWTAIRMSAYYELLTQLGVGQPPHRVDKRQRSLPRRLLDAAVRHTVLNPYLHRTPCRVLVLEHQRPVRKDGVFIDPHTRDIEARLTEQGTSFRALTHSYGGQYEKPLGPRRLPFSMVASRARMIRRRLDPCLPDEVRHRLSQVQHRCSSELGATLPLVELAERRLPGLLADVQAYDELLNVWKPERIALVVGYGPNCALTEAAHRRDLPVTEIQHGTFGRYHLGYSYPGRANRVPGFPDELEVWSDDWRKRAPFAKAIARVTVREPSWLVERRREYSGIERRQRALVVSQGLLGDRIASSLRDALHRLQGFEILYKLHPGEYDRADGYPALRELAASGRVRVLRDCDLPAELAASDLVVGVFSTVLFEAIDLGCRPYLLDLPGAEYLQDLLDQGHAELLTPNGPPIEPRPTIAGPDTAV